MAELIANPGRRPGEPLSRLVADYVGAAAAERVLALLHACPRYRPTPLLPLPSLARQLGIGALMVKDEAQRLGLESFKSLGGIYAIAEILMQAAGVGPDAIMCDRVRALAATRTFVCASDGNHGRSVAAGARLFGARSIVFLHEGVSAARAGKIAALGAEIIRVPGTYDDSVDEAVRQAEINGWTLVADTAADTEDPIPGLIMRGYTTIADEVLAGMEALGGPPSHLFVQAGVGGLAAAMTGHLRARLPGAGPIITVVEPVAADCLLQSAVQGRIAEVGGDVTTIYAMLECRRPSPLAWEVLRGAADFFLSVDDDAAPAAMRALAWPQGDDPGIVAGESGAASLAGLMTVLARASWREQLGLNAASRVLVINTEGATDPDLYARLVGRTAPQVA